MQGLQSYLLLLLLFIIGIFGKNQSIVVATVILFVLKITTLDQWLFPPLEKNGIQWGVTLLMVAVLVPIASGSIGVAELVHSVKSPTGIVAMLAGIIVALVPISGIGLLKHDPEITTSIVIGTILAVSLFKGIPVGPIIAAGLAAILIRAMNLLVQFLK